MIKSYTSVRDCVCVCLCMCVLGVDEVFSFVLLCGPEATLDSTIELNAHK